MNKERVQLLRDAGFMSLAGMKTTSDLSTEKFRVLQDILNAEKADAPVWKNFSTYPASCQRIGVGWIEGARQRPAEYEKRKIILSRRPCRTSALG
jgi:hypothetical protein